MVHATRRGRDAADDRIVALLAERSGVGAPGSGADTVVTADRALRDRVRQLGAGILGPSVLLSELTAE